MRAFRRTVATKSSANAKKRKLTKLRAEALEPRTMMTANSLLGLMATPNVIPLAGSGSAVHIYSPAQIRQAYGFNSLSLTGAGQTIAIVDAYNAPTIAADLHKFDTQFGLNDPKLTVYKQTKNGVGPRADAGWAMEIALDVEWAHAIAPGANILLVEANSSSLYDLLGAVDYARRQAGVSVVSMSWGAGEFNSEGMFDSYFTTPAGHAGVTFVASSGDSGAPASWPSISSNVVAVGGTTLSLNSSNGYAGEKGWGGSGGGYSPFLSEPSFQRGFQNTGRRSNPDVAYNADPSSGFYVYDAGSWYAVGGTSAGAPQWAALVALANQGRAAAGRGALGNTLQALYSLSSADFHDVTIGNNGYSAGIGYDAVTGRGSPIANLVVRDLINYGATTNLAAANGAVAPVGTTTAGKHAIGATGDAPLGDSFNSTTASDSSGYRATTVAFSAPTSTSSSVLAFANSPVEHRTTGATSDIYFSQLGSSDFDAGRITSADASDSSDSSTGGSMADRAAADVSSDNAEPQAASTSTSGDWLSDAPIGDSHSAIDSIFVSDGWRQTDTSDDLPTPAGNGQAASASAEAQGTASDAPVAPSELAA